MLKLLLFFIPFFALSNVFHVGKNQNYHTIKSAISVAKNGDTILVEKGTYREGNISITKPLVLIGKNLPVIDGQLKYEIFSFRANHIILKGFRIINSGKDEVKNIGAVRLYDSKYSIIKDNIFENNYFAITIQRGYRCLIENNKISTKRGTSQENIGDGIHAWVSEELWIKHNYITGHKDGIYLEKVKKSFIYRNKSVANQRYGLHFMFSDDDVYSGNIFENNNAGVAVMYSQNVGMSHNYFINNWGDGVYGLLLKDISYSKISNNHFISNTTAVLMDGATKIDLKNNQFEQNGWALKINSNCMENRLVHNNFMANTFDVSTNGSLVLNTFKNNFWDQYSGYDLDKNQIGDVPYHPLSLYAVLSENNPVVMLLYHTFFVDLLDRTEKIVPSITPENFVDETPAMKPNNII